MHFPLNGPVFNYYPIIIYFSLPGTAIMNYRKLRCVMAYALIPNHLMFEDRSFDKSLIRSEMNLEMHLGLNLSELLL